jgi:hypothetical protein
MSKRRTYTRQQKKRALAQLAANGHDVAFTSAQMGVPANTLWRWQREEPPPPNDPPPPTPPIPPTPPMSEAAGVAPPAPPVSAYDLETLTGLRDRLLGYTEKLFKRIDAQIEEASFNQSLTGLMQIIDRVMKLGLVLPPPAQEFYLPGQELVEALQALTKDEDDDEKDDAAAAASAPDSTDGVGQ